MNWDFVFNNKICRELKRTVKRRKKVVETIMLILEWAMMSPILLLIIPMVTMK